MGKILNALKTANGDISDLVLQCLDEPVRETPAARAADTRHFNGRGGAATSVMEAIVEKSHLIRLPQREESHDRPEPAQEIWQEAPETPPIRGRRRESGWCLFRFQTHAPCYRLNVKTAAPPSNTESSAPGSFISFQGRPSP
jgi:hypothetical protein